MSTDRRVTVHEPQTPGGIIERVHVYVRHKGSGEVHQSFDVTECGERTFWNFYNDLCRQVDGQRFTIDTSEMERPR